MFQGDRRPSLSRLRVWCAVKRPQAREATSLTLRIRVKRGTSKKPVVALLSNRSLYWASFTCRTEL